MTSSFVPGQRWISEAEPELGLGSVVQSGEGRVLLEFPASGERRQYAIGSAPLRRVAYRVGDRVVAGDGSSWEVAAVVEARGLLRYRDARGRELPEHELNSVQGFGSPLERLLNGQVDAAADCRLRMEALEQQHRRRRSPVRGFVGGRMDLIPHQLYLAREVTGRHFPRVLLADEVGLGKTVEACLVIHRLLATGRASRVLVVVPESLVHQWFVELLRRFHLWFHLFDEERCASIEAVHPEANPFLDDQLVLCGLSLLLTPRRAAQAAAAGWDLLVVDEAHHLAWSPESPSREYQVVEALSRRSDGLLLLTATPEQLGLASHFARLRLLDPDRYADLGRFEAEAAHYGAVARVAGILLGGGELGRSDAATLHRILGEEPAAIQKRLEDLAGGGTEAREELVSDLLDRHGPGRVMFRNTRAGMGGFPKRVPRPARLDLAGAASGLQEGLALEFESDLGPSGEARAWNYLADPRLDWLVELLRRLRGVKVLLICRTRAKVQAIDEALRTKVTVPTALFHEGLELVQRDRQAAWFAEPEGAVLLLASEIGSEGRNFQFAHHLVLWDLPLDPELVEQRIGRLDRIGQTANIEIHLPYVADSPQEVLFRWFHDGLNAFGHNLAAGRSLREEFGEAVRDLAMDFHETHATRRAELDALVEATARRRKALEAQLEAGRDRLLELNSCRPAVAREMADHIRAEDADPSLERFLLSVWDQQSVQVEDVGPRTYRLGSAGVFADAFPGLPSSGLTVTLDRATALAREDFVFLTWDHPMVAGALDLLLSAPTGNATVAFWPGARESGLWLEMVHLLECVAPARLHPDRFLAATPLRVVLDGRQREVTEAAARLLPGAALRAGSAAGLLEHPAVRDLLPRLAAAGQRLAEAQGKVLVDAAAAAIRKDLGHELERLRALAAVNPNVRPQEIEALEAQRDCLLEHIAGARVRLEAVRLIVLGEI